MGTAIITTWMSSRDVTPVNFSLFLSNVEALAQSTGELIQNPTDCLWNYDTPAWFVDDEYKLVCKNAQTKTICEQVKGHNFKNPGKCIPGGTDL